ncbi:MAG: hypothetical protein QOE63_1527 [Acidimicrobiaceae bacterium]
MIEAIGTYLPPWGDASGRVVAGDEDVVTMAVAAGLQAMVAAGADAARVRSLVLVTREQPLLVGGNGAALLAGLSLSPGIDVREVLGGAPAALEALATADTSTLVVAADVLGGAGAAAVLTGVRGAAIAITGRANRSLPVATRDARGRTTDYADVRLLRERGVGASIEQAGLAGKADAVAGLTGRDAAALCSGDPPVLSTIGASSALFALAALAERGDGGCVAAIEQATVAVAQLGSEPIAVARDEAAPQPAVVLREANEADIAISLAAYERAFDAKLRLEAARCTSCGLLAYPERHRCLGCGDEGATEPAALPRDAEIYTLATIHVPVPGLATPYTIVLAELGDSGVRLLVRLTGAPPGSVTIGDRGRMVFRRVAERMGVPDYGYAFLPETAA